MDGQALQTFPKHSQTGTDGLQSQAQRGADILGRRQGNLGQSQSDITQGLSGSFQLIRILPTQCQGDRVKLRFDTREQCFQRSLIRHCKSNSI